ncbi:hypothetical protein B0H14DRAFT_3450168 [Mycena olivaceomarginata]|nr:hypothetical protein B0H14DRAFT_3450168 [Mycena olivaceomarginata]
MPAVWYLLGRFTRSGREFSALSLSPFATLLQALDFNIAPLVTRAVAAEHDDQEDHEEEDASHGEEDAPHDDDALDEVGDSLPPDPLSEVDDVWPPPPSPGPWDEVDDDNPPPRKRRRRSYSPGFDEVVASAQEYQRLVDLKEKRWEMGLDLLSTLEELLAPVTS